ncbi:MAG: BrnT family toxin [Chitinophagales bacterium]|nr:BrnT family toxin [Chitinophagales bacterium]
MEFEWDEHKNQSNQLKHGVSFEEATQLFEDEKRIEYQDSRQDYSEERWKTIGKIFGISFSVTYTLRGTVIRLISARRASQKERELYESQ